LCRVGPVLIAVVAGYAAGLLSSHRVYNVPTYLLIGLLAVNHRLAACDFGSPPPKFDSGSARRLAVVSLAVVSALYVFTRLSVRWQ
jgi:hypothetical protein